MTKLAPIGIMLSVVFLCSHCAMRQSADPADGNLHGATSDKVGKMQATVQKQIRRIKRLDKIYNAFIALDESGARQSAAALDANPAAKKLPLAGFTLIIKDNIDMAGLPNSAGSHALSHFVPTKDAPIVTILKKAGAVIIGRANMHELGFGITSNNYAYGAVGNAHKSDYFAGGSSGGTATAIALNFVRAGLGTDTGGSSRIPAALNGIVGYRPTVGRYPQGGLFSLSSTRGTIGPMGRNVVDVALLDAVMAGEPTHLPQLKATDIRLGVPRKYFYADLSPDVAKVMRQTLTRLKAAGVTLVTRDLDVGELNQKVSFPIVLYETKKLLPLYLASRKIGLTLPELQAKIKSPDVKKIFGDLIRKGIPEDVYQNAIHNLRPQLQKVFRDYFSRQRVDAIIIPTTPMPAQPIKGSDEKVMLNEKLVPTFTTFIRNMDPSSNAGIPGLTIPAGKARNGLPIGVEIEGPEGSDRHLLAVGKVLESILAR